MLVVKVPLRISFLGGGTDLPEVINDIGCGKVITSTVDKFIYITIKDHQNFDEKYRLNYSLTETVSSIDKIKNNIIRNCLKFYDYRTSLYISTIADISSNTGLGSSSSFASGLVFGLNFLKKNKKLNPKKNSEIAYHIERNLVKSYCGKQDQYIACFGGFNLITFEKNQTTVSKISRKKNINDIFDSMSSFYLNKQRSAKNILKSQTGIINKKLNLYRELNALTDEGYNLMNSKCFNLRDFGKLIDLSWEIKRELSPLISNKVIDGIYEDLKKIGIYGGKLSGAGGTGFFNILHSKKNRNKIINYMKLKGFDYYNFNSYSSGVELNVI